MSIVILKRHFDAVPAATDIMQQLFGVDSGDRDKAKDALQAFLTPVKDLLDLLYLVDQMKDTAARHVELLHEQEDLTVEIAGVKAQLVSAKTEFESATKAQGVALAKVTADASAKVASLAAQVADLEKRKADLAKENEDEQTAKLRLNAVVSAEYDRLRAEMLAKVAEEEKAARASLMAIEAKVNTAQDNLDTLVEKKRQFLASLGG